MGGDWTARHERKAALARRADEYTGRLDQGLAQAWPDLAERLREAVAALSRYELAAGSAKDFREKRLGPAVAAWVERCVRPLLDEAAEAFRALAPDAPGSFAADPRADAGGKGCCTPPTCSRRWRCGIISSSRVERGQLLA